MFQRRSNPPVMGLLFLAAAVSAIGWAAVAETDPVIDHRSPPLIPAKAPAKAPAPHPGATALAHQDLETRPPRDVLGAG